MATATATKPTTATTGKRKKTAVEWAAAKKTAAAVTGYGNTSPIWGKLDTQVFGEIQAHLEALKTGTGTGLELDQAIVLVTELQKREAYKRLVATL